MAQRIAAIGSWENRIGANRLSWSDEIYRIFGLARTDFDATFDAFFARVHPDDRAAMLEAHEATLAGQGPMDIEHRIVRPDGTVRVVRERGERFREMAETIEAVAADPFAIHVEYRVVRRDGERRWIDLLPPTCAAECSTRSSRRNPRGRARGWGCSRRSCAATAALPDPRVDGRCGHQRQGLPAGAARLRRRR